MSDWDHDGKYRNKSDREFNELDYDTRKAFWFGWKWIAASVVAIFAIGALLWGLGVFTAGPKGAGDAYKTNQAGSNRIAKQEWFEQTYQDIQNADGRVVRFAAIAKADPSYVNKTNAAAAVEQCTQLVTNYNAEARKYTSQDWRDNKLPSAINQDDPKFDCKEEDK